MLALDLSQESGPSLSLEQVLIKLPTSGGMSLSCFPEAEQLLRSNAHNQTSLRRLCFNPRKSNQYRSMGDMVLCEVLPMYKAGCWNFYYRKGPLFIKLYSKRKVKAVDKFLKYVIEIAIEQMKTDEYVSWSKISRENIKSKGTDLPFVNLVLRE